MLYVSLNHPVSVTFIKENRVITLIQCLFNLLKYVYIAKTPHMNLRVINHSKYLHTNENTVTKMKIGQKRLQFE